MRPNIVNITSFTTVDLAILLRRTNIHRILASQTPPDFWNNSVRNRPILRDAILTCARKPT